MIDTKHPTIRKKSICTFKFMLPLTLTIVTLKYTGILICIIATFAAVQEGHFMRAGQGIKT